VKRREVYLKRKSSFGHFLLTNSKGRKRGEKRGGGRERPCSVSNQFHRERDKKIKICQRGVIAYAFFLSGKRGRRRERRIFSVTLERGKEFNEKKRGQARVDPFIHAEGRKKGEEGRTFNAGRREGKGKIAEKKKKRQRTGVLYYERGEEGRVPSFHHPRETRGG